MNNNSSFHSNISKPDIIDIHLKLDTSRLADDQFRGTLSQLSTKKCHINRNGFPSINHQFSDIWLLRKQHRLSFAMIGFSFLCCLVGFVNAASVSYPDIYTVSTPPPAPTPAPLYSTMPTQPPPQVYQPPQQQGYSMPAPTPAPVGGYNQPNCKTTYETMQVLSFLICLVFLVLLQLFLCFFVI